MIIETYRLNQQTPMIHFQSEEEGATLRAGEVKPKLDRFLVEKIGESNIPLKWWLGYDYKEKKLESKALNYKMRIIAKTRDTSHPVYIKPEKGKLKGIGEYFLTERDERKIKKDSFYKDIKLTLICGVEGLQEKLCDEALLCEFFATHNFGFRQNKGFGSFIFGGNERTEVTERWIAESYTYVEKYSGYYLDIPQSNTTTILEVIKDFWQVVKSGINLKGNYERSFLMKNYFSGHLNDKKAMKLALLNTELFKLDEKNKPREGIKWYDDDLFDKSNKIDLTPENPPISLEKAEYVRGLLGFAQHYQFLRVTLKNEQEKPFAVTFSLSVEGVERMSAPVYFKPIISKWGTRVYLLLDNKLLESVYTNIGNGIIKLTCKANLGKGYRDDGDFCKQVKVAIQKVNKQNLEFHLPDLGEISPKLFLDMFFSEIWKSPDYKERKIPYNIGKYKLEKGGRR